MPIKRSKISREGNTEKESMKPRRKHTNYDIKKESARTKEKRNERQQKHSTHIFHTQMRLIKMKKKKHNNFPSSLKTVVSFLTYSLS